MKQLKLKVQVNDYVRYWRPRKGGWYHARLVSLGRKWAWVKPLEAYNGIVIAEGRRLRVPVADVQEVAS